MTQVDFFGQLNALLDAPNALDKARDLILEAALQGKLDAQDHKDEPATVVVAKAQLARSNAPPDRKNPHAPRRFTSPRDYPLPAGWMLVRLGQVAKITRGVRYSSLEMSKVCQPGKIACLRAVNIGDAIKCNDLIYISESLARNQDHWIKPNDLVISISNSPAKVGKIACAEDLSERVTFGGFLAVIRPFEIDATYLLLFLRSASIQKALRATASQTTGIANIHLAALRALPVPIPPLAEQKRIAAKAKALFALCEEIAARSTAFCGHRSDLIQRLSVDFGPNFKTDEYRSHFRFLIDAFPYLSSAPDFTPVLRRAILTLAVCGRLTSNEITPHPPFEGSNADALCPIPKSWRWVIFGDITKSVLSGLHRTNAAQANDRAVGYIKTSNITPGYHCDLTHVSRIDITPDESSKYRLSPGDFLFNKVNSPELVGTTCIFQPAASTDAFVFSQSILKVEFKDDVDPNFINLWCSSAMGQRELAKLKAGTTRVTQISAQRLKTLIVPLPPLLEQQCIVARTDKLLQLCSELETAFNSLALSRKSLLDSISRRGRRT